MVLRNEQDVREEVATPFLKGLGYEAGSANDIHREMRLRYAAMQLGRKKPNDMPLPLGGDADYLLTVSAAGRWILETKPPYEDITEDDIDQATSYARHPEVAGQYAAVLNGKRFVLYHASQTSNDKAILDIPVVSGAELAKQLQGVLSPASIRRDCTPPVIDLNAPLADAFRSEAAITGGWNKQLENAFFTELPITPEMRAQIEDEHLKLTGMISTVKSGRIWRDDASRIRARLSWNPPHEDMKAVLEHARLDDFEYVCLDQTISVDPERPSVFDILGEYQIREGQVMYDILQWKSYVMGVPMDFVMRGQATGFLRGDTFQGLADFTRTMWVKGAAHPLISRFLTQFSFTVDTR